MNDIKKAFCSISPNSLTGKLGPSSKCATGIIYKSHEKLYASGMEKLNGFNANTEKFPSESPNLSIFIFDPVTP